MTIATTNASLEYAAEIHVEARELFWIEWNIDHIMLRPVILETHGLALCLCV